PATALLRPALAEAEDYTTAWRKLVSCFREQGWNIVVAMLTRDRELERFLPCALRVLAVRQESAEMR
ncbi:MAG TPA: hypothetical protein VFN35_32845, partial [Ktedonobacteraceae bacterium]|nr:hypothetical protein [Ktedonobacteraceae bacterium]